MASVRFIIILILCELCGCNAISQTSKVKHLSQDEALKKVTQLQKECWELREIKSDSAIILGKMGLELALQYELKKELPRLYAYIGIVNLHYLNNIKEATFYFQHSLETSLRQNDSIQLAYSYNNLGDLYLLTGNIPLSREFSVKSVELFQKLKNKRGMSYSFMNMGLLCRAEKDFTTAMVYLKKAKALWEELGNNTGAGLVLLEMANTYEAKGDYDTAMSYYENAYKESIGLKTVKYGTFCLQGIANIYYSRGNYDKAFEFYKRALAFNKERKYYYGIIDNYIGIALVYANKGERKIGEESLHKALSLSKSLNLNTKILKSYESFVKFYEILNDYQKAIEWYNNFSTPYDSILTVQHSEIVYQMRNRFRIEQSLSNTKQELNAQKLKYINLWLIVVLLIAIMLILIWRYLSNRKMNKQLEEMNNAKDKLFSVISHDLKNPFNSLIGFSELLLSEIDNCNYSKIKEYAIYLNQASEEGLKLLTNLLHWSLSQAGRIKFKPEPLNLNEVFSELKVFYNTEIEKRKLNLKFENSIQNKILADRDIIKIILMNLITNSLKYTRENGMIRVSASQNKDVIYIQVEDTGIGMSEDTQKLLFAKTSFVNSKKGLREERGTGLGLSIVSEFIRIHKGEIKVSSEEGVGSRFELKFPVDFN